MEAMEDAKRRAAEKTRRLAKKNTRDDKMQATVRAVRASSHEDQVGTENKEG